MTKIEEKFIETLESCWYNQGVDENENLLVKMRQGFCSKVITSCFLYLNFHCIKYLIYSLS